jgi:uncharacterized protein
MRRLVLITLLWVCYLFQAAPAWSQDLAQQLSEAAFMGRLDKVKQLIEEGADVNGNAESGLTPLAGAANYGHFSVVQFLLENGAVPTITDKEGKNALEEALKAAQPKIVRLLIPRFDRGELKKRYDWSDLVLSLWTGGKDQVSELGQPEALDNQDRLGITPLMVAAGVGQAEAVEQLLKRGANWKTASPEGVTALHWAARSGDPRTVRLILIAGAALDDADYTRNRTPLIYAAMSGDLAVVQALLDQGANVNLVTKDDRTALSMAVARNHANVAQLLLDRGADPNVQQGPGRGPLWSAVYNGQTKIIHALLDKGAKPDSETLNAAIFSPEGQANRLDIVRLLLDRGAPVETMKMAVTDSPVANAVVGGFPRIVELLLERGANPNEKGPEGMTLLMVAASLKNGLEQAKILLARGADLNARGDLGLTALSIAHLEGTDETVKFLESRGAKVDKNNLGDCIAAGEREWVQLLLDGGANVNAALGFQGLTPLMLASLGEDEEIVRLLLAKGANVNSEDSGGRTAVNFAEMKNNSIIVALLEQHGGRSSGRLCEEQAANDLMSLAKAFERLRNELVEHKCDADAKIAELLKAPDIDLVGLMVGPYYGWMGTSHKCGVRVRAIDGELRACATKGRPSKDNSTHRTIYRVPLPPSSGSPVETQGACEGRPYGGPEGDCYSKSILDDRCGLKKPVSEKCKDLKSN